MIGYSIDEFINLRLSEQKEREVNHKDQTFHSCEHCLNYKNHCKILERKLKVRKTGWSNRDYTVCRSWKINL
jgi:hypothetical protein